MGHAPHLVPPRSLALPVRGVREEDPRELSLLPEVRRSATGMKMVRPLTPKVFAKSFHDLFVKSAVEGGETEVGIHWSRPEPEETGMSGKLERDTEWTAIMSIFLSRLASKNKCYQEWELRAGRKRIDYGWYGKDDMKTRVVIIEHENKVATAMGEELPKLIDFNCDLKVLVTYEWTHNTPEVIRKNAERVLKGRPSMEGNFLLIIGINDVDKPSDWRFFCWDRANEVMEDITDELDD